MNIQLNVFYGMLTNGDTTERKTTEVNPTNKDALRIITALVPSGVRAETRRALAELYIRLIQTDVKLQQLLKKIDPVNSYKLQSFQPPFSEPHIIEKIVENIKALGLPDEENSSLPFDYIINALRVLLEELHDN